MKLIVQVCPSTCLSHKPLWSSKQLDLLLITPSGLGCAKSCQWSKRRDLSWHLVSGWLEARPSNSNFYKYVQSCGTTIINPAGLQVGWSEGVPCGAAAKTGPLEECINSFQGGTSEPWQSRQRAERRHSQACVLWEYLLVFRCVPDLSLLLRLRLGCVSCLYSSLRLIDFQDLSDCYSPVGPRMQACQFQSQAIKEHPLCSGPYIWTPDVKTGAADLWLELPFEMPVLWIAVEGRV